MLHEFPSEHREGKRGSVPIDRCIDVDGFEHREQVPLLVIKRGQQRLPSQRPGVVLVPSRPIYFSRGQRGSVDTAHADHVAQLLRERREAAANPMRRRCARTFPAGRA